MAKKSKDTSCYEQSGKGMCCYKVESLISVDERGQMVIPKGIRDKANIRPGDKLALVSCERGGKVCCIFLIKAEDLAEMVKGLLGPVIEDMLKK